MPEKLRRRHESHQCRGLLGFGDIEFWMECYPFPYEIKGWPWGATWRAEYDPHHTLPHLWRWGSPETFPGRPRSKSERNRHCPYSSGLRGKHANTTNQTAPERNTTTTSPHATRDNDGFARSPCSRWWWVYSARVIPQHCEQELLSNLQSLPNEQLPLGIVRS